VQRLSADGAPAIRFEKRLTPEVLIAAAAKATRLDAKPLADLASSKRSAPSLQVSTRRRRCRPSDVSRRAGT
jgi:hypothetical protein